MNHSSQGISRMKKNLVNSIWLTCLFLFASVPPGSVVAGEALELDLTRHGSMIKSAFIGVVQQSQHVVVEVEINREITCPGTLIEYRAKGKSALVVCKASLLGEHVSLQDQFRCHAIAGAWQSAKFLGYDKDLDLSFLRVDFPDAKKQIEIRHAKNSQPGQWLISPGYQQKLPLGVGVLGAEPREIDSSAGYAGLSVDETEQGLSITKVMANSGAAHAGFLTGDFLMESEERPASKRRWLSRLLGQYEPGDWLIVLAKRGEEVIRFDLQIGTTWNSTLNRQALMNRFGSDVSERRTGFRSVIQHDTILHPKHCGGPIVNLKGELVGVNIARAGRTDTLAVPVAEILKTARKFEEK